MAFLGSRFFLNGTKEKDVETQTVGLLQNVSANRATSSSPQPGLAFGSPMLESNAEQNTLWRRVSLLVTDAVEISVGEGNQSQAFRVYKQQICKYSEYFREALEGGRQTRSAKLPSEDPLLFQMFHGWVQQPEQPIKYEPGIYTEEPWRSNAAQLWVLGKRLKAEEFVSYAFCQFISNCALVDLSTWEFIEAEVREGSSLRRFSNHWIAWNVSLSQTEYVTLKAASLADQVSDKTRDPRTYDIAHWDVSCSDDLGSVCEHNTGAPKAVNNHPVKRRDSETGRDWELGQQGPSDSPSTALLSPRPKAAAPHPVTQPQPQTTTSKSKSRKVKRPSVCAWLILFLSILAVGAEIWISAHLLRKGRRNRAARYQTKSFSLFAGCWNGLTSLVYLLQACRSSVSLAIRVFLTVFVFLFSLGAGIATAIDASKCQNGYGWVVSCQLVLVLTVCMWLSIGFSLLLGVSIPRR